MRLYLPDACMGQLLEAQSEIFRKTYDKPTFCTIIQDALDKYLGYLRAGR